MFGDFGAMRISDDQISEMIGTDLDILEQRSVLLFYAFDSTHTEKCCERTFTDAFLDHLKQSCSPTETVQEEINPSCRRVISDSCSDFDEHSLDGDDDGNADLDESDDSTLEEENLLSRAIDIQESRGKVSVVRR